MIAENEEQLEKLTAMGKQGKLWTVAVRYTSDYSNETKIWKASNMTGDEVMKFREAVFKVGLRDMLDPGHYIIIPPWLLREIHCERQSTFFAP